VEIQHPGEPGSAIFIRFLLSAMSIKAVMLDHIGSSRCNFGDFEESIDDTYAAVLDGKAQAYWRVLAATKAKPVGKRKTEEDVNRDVASVVDADAYGPELQNANEELPGYRDVSAAAITRLNETRAADMARLLANTRAGIKGEDLKKVERENEEFDKQGPVVYAFIKARLSPRVLSALEATEGFAAIAASHDATGLWKAILLKYGKGTTGAAHLTMEANDEIDRTITDFKIQRGEDLHQYYKRFTKLLRQAKLADRPELEDADQVFRYLKGLVGHSKYGAFKAHEDQLARDRADNQEEGEADMTLVRIHNRALSFVEIREKAAEGAAPQSHAFPVTDHGELNSVEASMIKKAAEQQIAERDAEQKLIDRVAEVIRTGSPAAHVFATTETRGGGSTGRNGQCANCLRHGEKRRDHTYWECTQITGRALASDLQQKDQAVKAKKEAAKDIQAAKELAELAAAAKKAQEAQDKKEKEILFGMGIKKTSKYLGKGAKLGESEKATENR